METRDKIEVVYPDGKRDCQAKVADTYRNAISFLGLEAVRALGMTRNSINIVSTREEMELSTGGKKETATITMLANPTDLGICTQFSTRDKYRILLKLNEALDKGLTIRLLDSEAEISASMNPSPDESKAGRMPERKETHTLLLPAEEATGEIKEGLMKEFRSTRYERDPKARELCIRHYGIPVVCQICGFDFEKTYGKREDKNPYIEVHHITPLNEKEGKEYPVDYTRDLIPVCANCHRMLHHLRPHVLHPDELREILNQMKQ